MSTVTKRTFSNKIAWCGTMDIWKKCYMIKHWSVKVEIKIWVWAEVWMPHIDLFIRVEVLVFVSRLFMYLFQFVVECFCIGGSANFSIYLSWRARVNFLSQCVFNCHLNTVKWFFLSIQLLHQYWFCISVDRTMYFNQSDHLHLSNVSQLHMIGQWIIRKTWVGFFPCQSDSIAFFNTIHFKNLCVCVCVGGGNQSLLFFFYCCLLLWTGE